MDAQTGALVVALLAAGWLITAIWLLLLSVSIRKINKRGKAIAEAGQSGDFVAAVEKSLSETGGLRADLDALSADHTAFVEAMTKAVQRVGVVRFDAFDDTGGMLSFSAALLDNNGDGVVISAINGRQESRSYAKLIRNATSEHNLSTEERQAIAEALAGARSAVTA